MTKQGSGWYLAAPLLFLSLLLPMAAAGQVAADRVPGTEIGYGTRTIAAAWFARPTTRYPHGALGDTIEAGSLVVRDAAGRISELVLPEDRVFEDQAPRIVADPQLGDLVMVVESQRQSGARLSVYGLTDGQIVLRAATPHIDIPNRWLAPVGIGDFDGDGTMEVALVAMPHLVGLLRIYGLRGPTMPLLAEAAGYSNHVFGTPEIAMSAVLPAPDGDRILVPSLDRRRLVRMAFREGRLTEEWAMALPARLIRFVPEPGRCHAELEGGGRVPFDC